MVNETRRTSHANDLSATEGGWLDALARRYSPALSRFFLRRVDLREDAADLVQEVFVRLARLPDAEQIRQPENYLFTTASNTLKDHFRRAGVRQADRQEIFDPDRHGGSDLTPADILEGRQAVERLQVALKALPERTRDVFILKALEERRTEAVARTLGISTRAVEKHQARALASIAVALAPFRD